MSLSLDRSLLKPVATVVAIVLSLFQIYFTGGFGVTDAHILRGTHLTLIMILVLLLVPSRKLAPGEKEGWFPILIDLALIALAIAINVYVFQEADNISRRLKYVEDVTNLDLFYGTGLVLLVLEATRRTSGWPLVIVSGSFLAYAMFGEYMPGGLAHNGIEYDRLIEQLFLLTDGIYGVPLGAAAFIMADVIGVSYLTIAKAALIPSVLYYLTLLAIIHLEAVSKNMGTLPPELVPSAASVLRRLYYLFPLVFLITILLMGRSVIACAYYGTVCIVILSMIRSETRFTFKRLCGALELSAKNAMMVSSCCACAGIIIGVISLTGIGYKFINVITALAGSNLLLLMAMLMVTCIILGMGVPTAPAYIIVATLGAPALMKAGVPIIAAHMFVYFYAILSVITPPVCLAAFAGAAIAETNAMKTGVTAMKLGIVAFIIPFMFVFEPALLMQGSTTEIATAFASALIGVIGIASGMQNWLLVRCRLWERALLLASGLMLIFPGLITDTIGLSSLLIVLFAQRLRKGGSPIAAA